MLSVLTPEILVLLASATSIAVVHTLMGPDHYLPFVSLALARQWRWRRVLGITALCGCGHLLGSVILGLVGIWAQAELTHLVHIESRRGDLAAWVLLSIGLVYLAWGIRNAGRQRVHRHGGCRSQWLIFLVFVLGPCEPLIPLLMYPAAESSAAGILLVAGAFGVATVLSMLAAVSVALYSLRRLPLARPGALRPCPDGRHPHWMRRIDSVPGPVMPGRPRTPPPVALRNPGSGPHC